MTKQFVAALKSLPPSVTKVALAFLATSAVGFAVARYNIWLVSAGLAVVGLVALMFVKPQIATLTILFVVYANLTVIAVRRQNLPEVLAGSVLLLLAIPLFRYLIIERQKPIANRVFFLMLGYLVVQVISALFSADATQSFERVTTYLLEGLVVYILLLNVMRSRDLLRKAIWTLILAGAFMGSISLYQEATRSYDNQLGGLAQTTREFIGTGELGFDGKPITRSRLAGPVGETNRYAQIMVILLPLAFFRAWSERRRILKFLALAACVPILGGVLLTFSRGAALTLAAVLIFMSFLGYIRLRYILLSAIGAVVLAVFVVPDSVYRLRIAVSGVGAVVSGEANVADSSIRGRVTENLATLKLFLDHPVLGVGPGRAKLYMEEYAANIGLKKIDTTRRSHNMYLEELADTGVIGFAAFMAIVLVTLRDLARARRFWRRRDLEFANTATALAFSILTYLGTAVFLHLSYQRYYWLLLALAGAAVQIFRADSGHSEGTEQRPRASSGPWDRGAAGAY